MGHPAPGRYHGGELEIPVYPADRFFDRDYGVFGFSGVACGEVATKDSGTKGH